MKALALIAFALGLSACGAGNTDSKSILLDPQTFTGTVSEFRTVNSKEYYYWVQTLKTESDGAFEFISLCGHDHSSDVIPFIEKKSITVELIQNFEFPQGLVDLTNPPKYALECGV